MTWTKTDIANQALLRLGEKTIGNIDDEAEPAPTMKALLASVAREVQTEFPWRELVRRTNVDADPTDDDDGRHRYAIPGDTMRVLAVNPASGLWVEYQWEGNFVLTTLDSPIVLEYLRYEDDPAIWSIHLARATFTALAATAALALTQNAGIEERMRAEAQKTIDTARRLQSSDSSPHSYLPRYHGWRQSRRVGYW